MFGEFLIRKRIIGANRPQTKSGRIGPRNVENTGVKIIIPKKLRVGTIVALYILTEQAQALFAMAGARRGSRIEKFF
jgi:hypothetical protein